MLVLQEIRLLKQAHPMLLMEMMMMQMLLMLLVQTVFVRVFLTPKKITSKTENCNFYYSIMACSQKAKRMEIRGVNKLTVRVTMQSVRILSSN